MVKLDDTVGKYNNKYHRTTKMKPAHVKDNIYILILKKKLMIETLNSKLVIL